MRLGWRSPRLWLVVLACAGASLLASQPAAGLGLKDVIVWDPVRRVWVDAKTKGVVTVTANSKTQPPDTYLASSSASSGYTQQGHTRPQKASAKEFFPLVIPDMDWWKTCDKNTSDILTMMTTKCDIFKDIVNCQQLAQMGYLPSGIQSFVPSSLHGGFTLPNGCSSGNLGIEYDGLKLVFNSPQIPIMAVIAKDIVSKVYYFGSGVTQGKLLKLLVKKAEFCYAPPSMSPLYVSKTAAYSTGMQPGSASWNFFKTVQLAPPFTNNIASMFRGDTADATWALQVQKTGTDTVYQGAVTGQITVTNPQAVPVTVYSINDYVQGGPSSTVSCGTNLPFQVPACSSSVCNYVGYWPLAPAAGTYTGLADVSYSVGDQGNVGNQVGTSTFQVGTLSPAVGMMNTPSGQQIPAGQAVVVDAMAPQQYFFSGSAQQTYVTQLSCPETGIITNQATLTAATGQQITQSATVQKLCFDLQVRVAQAASPFVGKWSWDVKKEASAPLVVLKPSATAWDKYVKQQMDLAIASGQDPSAAMELITGGGNTTGLSAATLDGSMTGEVTYKVTFTRMPPGGFVAGAPAFQAVGDVFITNSSPLNAQLKEVTVSVSNPFGGVPYRVGATCPILTVAAGQTLQCRYIAAPPFNPIGAQVVAIAHYLNVRNGVPTGATTPFTSAPTTIGGGGGPPPGPGPMPPPPGPGPMPPPPGPGPQPPLPGPGPQPPAVIVPQVAAGRKLLAADSVIGTALNGIVKTVSSRTISGGDRRAAAAGGAALRLEHGNGTDDAASPTSTISLGNPLEAIGKALKRLNLTIETTEGEQGDSGDVAAMIAEVLPKLGGLGLDLNGVDVSEVLGLLQAAVPSAPGGQIAELLKHLPKLPKFPPKFPPQLPSLSVTTTDDGEGGDEDDEVTLDGVSKALTKLTHLVERNNKSTITVTARSTKPTGSLLGGLIKFNDGDAEAEAEGEGEPEGDGEGDGEPDGDGAGEPQQPTVAAGATSPAELRGLSDECVEVKDVFATGAGFTTGMIVSGNAPSGRICDSSTFTYTVRYGPYAECFDKRAVNKAGFRAADTGALGEASSTVGVKVHGCGAAVTVATKSYAVWAKRTYAWSVAKSVSPPVLEVAQGRQGSATYTVSYERREVLSEPKLSASVQFGNLNLHKPVTLSTFSYKVTSQCPDGPRHKSGTFSCGANTIPAGGTPLTCKVRVDLPCAAPGTFVAHAAAGDKAIKSMPFRFPAPEATEDDESGLASRECVMVTDEFKNGDNLVKGSVAAEGMQPYGKLCGSKDFTYSATFGPFSACGKKKAINIASLSSGTPDGATQTQATLTIQVTDCALYTPVKKNTTFEAEPTVAPRPQLPAMPLDNVTLVETVTEVDANISLGWNASNPSFNASNPPRLEAGDASVEAEVTTSAEVVTSLPAGSCVSSVPFWKNCMQKDGAKLAGRCAVVLKLPGGPHTPFFPQPASAGAKTRTYKAVMVKATNSGNKGVDMWFKASQALVAAQLNELAGVVLPQTVRDAVSLIGSIVGTTSATPPTLNTQLPGLPSAINLLEMFSAGQTGVEPC